MALHFKTPGDHSPQGKPRVYFCCHPEDHDRYFDSISEEILSLQNCAIYYYDALPVPAEDRDLDLKQMQLFVMPVTTRLLTADNPAMADFRFAMENHIPVLPLLQERGLERIFNQKCGDLQCLDKQDEDPTAIPYLEKLKKYLRAVLIGDELAQRIRCAFGTYLFLSYRKKDRRHAQELMRRIHRIDFCRDIAIWYDEFLTPGENFNESIAQALKKSEIFALVVTPNLVNEENYIQKVEYPMAKEAGKPILPLEMVATDAGALRRCYDSIPDAAAAWEEPSLRKALGAVAKLLPPERTQADPVHDYYIGLAYLGGVDVEVDHERALALITAAAEAELPEAMEKLVSMYKTGEGVSVNYGTAFQWQEKLAICRKQEYDRDPGPDTYASYCDTLRDLIDDAIDMGQPSIAAFFGTMMQMHAQEAGYARCHRDLAASQHILGSIHRIQGNLQQAQRLFEQGLAIREALVSENGTVEARWELSDSYTNLGELCQAQGDLKGALDHFSSSLILAEAIVEETNTLEARRHLAICYHRMAGLCKAQGDLPATMEYMEKVLEINKYLAAETGTERARLDLSVGYTNLGLLYEAQKNWSDMMGCYMESMKIADGLVQETGSVKALDNLATICYTIGRFYQRDHMQRAHKIWTFLAQQFPQIPNYTKKREGAKRALDQMQ